MAQFIVSLLPLQVVAGCVPIPVYCKDPVVGPSPNELENATRKAEIRGHKVKILLLNNPNNPLGIIYPPHVMSNAIQWAQNRSIHTIANEIYALSTHQVRDIFVSFYIRKVQLLACSVPNALHRKKVIVSSQL